jgi:Pentapeptide repeats (9 copies)
MADESAASPEDSANMSTQKSDFRGANFTEWADFRGAKFTERATFQGAAFTEVANFDGATFTGKAYFQGTNFQDGHRPFICRTDRHGLAMWKLIARGERGSAFADAAQTIIKTEDHASGAIFFRVYVDPTRTPSDAEVLSRLEYQSAKRLYQLQRDAH